MKNQNKKNRSMKVLGTTLALALLVGGTVGIVNHYERPQISDEVNDEQDVTIRDHGVTLKLLQKTNNSYGEVDQTFTYSVTPSNATNQAVTAVAKYQDGTSCDAVMAVSVDTSAKTIKLSCKGAFSKKITVTVTSSANSSAKGTVTVDYVKKLKSITAKNTNIQIGGKNTSTANDYVKKDKISWTDFYTPNYSVYTKDKNYTFTTGLFEDQTTYDIQFDEEIGITGLPSDYREKFESLVRNAIANQSGITDDQIWNLYSTNAYHSALVDAEWDAIVNFECSIKTTSDGKEALSSCYIAIGLGRDWSSRSVGVDSLTLESSALEF